MTPGDRNVAQSALNAARATHARLDQIRGPEDTAADIIDLWGAAESAMRAMLGGSVLSGQNLVRELRQRGSITLEQANALASFWDSRSRMDDVNYKPTLTDVGYARAGYNELVKAVNEPTAQAQATTSATASAANAVGPTSVPMGVPLNTTTSGTTTTAAAPSSNRRRISIPVISAIAGAIVVIIVGIVIYLVMRPTYNKEMSKAIDLMQTGQIEAAQTAFSQIAANHPDQAEPHVFLSRLARMDHDMNTARSELVTAIRIEPKNAAALREMGIFLLVQNNPDLARNFLVRAVQAAPSDSAAQGYLGCAMLKLNRVEEGQRFLSRAGPGSWSACTPPATPATAATH